MKTNLLAVGILAVLLIATILNTLFIHTTADGLTDKIQAEDSDRMAEALYEEFLAVEGWLSLSVSHEELMGLSSLFAEWAGIVQGGEEGEATEPLKSRLKDALRHLKRHGGLTAQSIF